MSKNGPTVSQATAAVLMARARYPKILEAIVHKVNAPAPYMKEKIDYRARDKQLLMMGPDEMIALARTDPAAAEAAAARIAELEARAEPLPPGMGEFEGEP